MAHSGDVEGLLESFEPLILKLTSSPLHEKNNFDFKLSPDEQEDLKSQIIFMFIELFNEYKPEEGTYFTYYIKEKLTWRVNNHVRKMIPEKKYRVDLNLEEVAEEEIEEENENTDQKEEKYKELVALFDILPKKRREIMKLLYIENLSISGAAKKLSISPQAVDRQKSLAVKTLQNLLKKDSK